MSARDHFTLWLYDLDAGEISFEVLGDRRHVLSITRDVSVIVRPETDDLTVAITGLRKLAAAAGEMADALAGNPDGAA